jgi:fructosamine-3-kinase
MEPVYGGDINSSFRLGLEDGRQFFIKVNRKENIGSFHSEEAALHLMAQTHTVGIPQVYCCGTVADAAYLAMEFLQQQAPYKGYYMEFATELAAMHNATTTKRFGFSQDNNSGRTVQSNGWENSWIEFYRTHRLAYQIKLNEKWFDKKELSNFTYLLDHLDNLLVEPEHPSLLHGDLWSGNYMCAAHRPYLFDPACYYGHYEVDIAMSELFGRLPQTFYDIYGSINSLYGYEERRDLYNLYHLLNHLHLFGGSYRQSVLTILKEYT